MWPGPGRAQQLCYTAKGLTAVEGEGMGEGAAPGTLQLETRGDDDWLPGCDVTKSSGSEKESGLWDADARGSSESVQANCRAPSEPYSVQGPVGGAH